jgi:predicted ATPase
MRRSQIFDETFTPKLVLPTQTASTLGSVSTLDASGLNLPYVLDYLRLTHSEVYSRLEDDMRWLLHHIDAIETALDVDETRIRFKEKAFANDAPTISYGSSRLLALLTAYYLWEADTEPRSFDPMIINGLTVMKYSDMPGLIAFEEPDTALNPQLLGRFVSLLRGYTQREPTRQFIFTTHSPTFLDHFEPEEVRVVERDADGYTRVNEIPPSVREIWLDKYGLGEVWTTRSIGGVPE